jgi:nitroreductase
MAEDANGRSNGVTGKNETGLMARWVRRNRSCRRFVESIPVDRNTLESLVDLGRLSASGANRQPLLYLLSYTNERNAKVFPRLGWAAYLKDWPGPAEGERPAAYIVILGDTQITRDFGVDHGIAAQSILLGAVEKGLSGCMIGSVNRKSLATALDIPDRYEILLVIALGVPGETVVIDEVSTEGGTRYWRDESGVHHVPKRKIADVIVDF